MHDSNSIFEHQTYSAIACHVPHVTLSRQDISTSTNPLPHLWHPHMNPLPILHMSKQWTRTLPKNRHCLPKLRNLPKLSANCSRARRNPPNPSPNFENLISLMVPTPESYIH